MGDANPIRTLEDYSKPSHEGYRNTIELPVGNNVDCKTSQRHPDVPTTSRRISLRSMDLFQGLTPKSPSSWHRSLAPKDLALYDYKSWNDPRDFAKAVKEISLPQDILIKRVDVVQEEHPIDQARGKRESYKPRPSSDGIGARNPYYARKDFLDCHLPEEWEIAET
ncbi:hypothetical protein Tco_0179605 [Tanacetum coccineum]